MADDKTLDSSNAALTQQLLVAQGQHDADVEAAQAMAHQVSAAELAALQPWQRFSSYMST